MRELLTVEQYLDELLALVRPDERVERVALGEAFGRVLAGTVTSAASIPAFDNSWDPLESTCRHASLSIL